MTDKYASESLGALRIVTALLFIQHGTAKLFAVPIRLPGGRVPIESLMGFAGVLEAAGGFLVLIGLLSRHVSLLLAAEMVVAYFMAHAVKGPIPIANGGELAIMFCFAFMAIAGMGPGAWAVDGNR